MADGKDSNIIVMNAVEFSGIHQDGNQQQVVLPAKCYRSNIITIFDILQLILSVLPSHDFSFSFRLKRQHNSFTNGLDKRHSVIY